MARSPRASLDSLFQSPNYFHCEYFFPYVLLEFGFCPVFSPCSGRNYSPPPVMHASPASWVGKKLFSLTCCPHSRCSPGCSCPASLQGHTADSCSSCPPGPPGTFLQSHCPAGQSPACALIWRCSVPGVGLCIHLS